MQNPAPTNGFNGHIHFRCNSDMVPEIHAIARQRGLTAASWLRLVVLDALRRNAFSNSERHAA